MLETLILYSLLERNLTTYGIRKHILQDFSFFANPSLGAIHPAILKLIKKNYISVTKNITDGGQKSLFHTLLPEGKKYFYKNWAEISSSVAQKISTEIKMKIIMLPAIKSEEAKASFYTNAANILEILEYDIKNKMKENTCGYFQTSASLFYKEISGLRDTIEKLKKEN